MFVVYTRVLSALSFFGSLCLCVGGVGEKEGTRSVKCEETTTEKVSCDLTFLHGIF